MDQKGKETKGTLEVGSQNEAIGRVKEMGLFPTKIVEIDRAKDKPDKKAKAAPGKAGGKKGALNINLNIKIPGIRKNRANGKPFRTEDLQNHPLLMAHLASTC